MTQTGYVYDADHYCEDCTMKWVNALKKDSYVFSGNSVPEDYDWSHANRRATLIELIEDGVIRDGEGNGIHPLFDTEETDTPVHCCSCHEYLDTSWTQDCQNYVVEAFGRYIESYIYPQQCEHAGDPDVLDTWAEHADDSTAKDVFLFIRGEET